MLSRSSKFWKAAPHSATFKSRDDLSLSARQNPERWSLIRFVDAIAPVDVPIEMTMDGKNVGGFSEQERSPSNAKPLTAPLKNCARNTKISLTAAGQLMTHISQMPHTRLKSRQKK
jgi:hypothetical protein